MSYVKHKCFFSFLSLKKKCTKPLYLINTDNLDNERHLNFKKTALQPKSLVFKWLHLNISFLVPFQTWAINHPYEHNGLCL